MILETIGREQFNVSAIANELQYQADTSYGSSKTAFELWRRLIVAQSNEIARLKMIIERARAGELASLPRGK